MRSRLLTVIILGALLVPVTTSSVGAQVRAVNDYGALGLGRLLKRINTTASVMMIGAHPDDDVFHDAFGALGRIQIEIVDDAFQPRPTHDLFANRRQTIFKPPRISRLDDRFGNLLRNDLDQRFRSVQSR